MRKIKKGMQGTSIPIPYFSSLSRRNVFPEAPSIIPFICHWSALVHIVSLVGRKLGKVYIYIFSLSPRKQRMAFGYGTISASYNKGINLARRKFRKVAKNRCCFTSLFPTCLRTSAIWIEEMFFFLTNKITKQHIYFHCTILCD